MPRPRNLVDNRYRIVLVRDSHFAVGAVDWVINPQPVGPGALSGRKIQRRRQKVHDTPADLR